MNIQIILFRHGIALDSADAEAAGIREQDRPLTRQGIDRTGEAAIGLRRVADSVELIAHSPLARARQTADILAAAYPSARRAETRALRPGTAAESLAQTVAQRMRRGADGAAVLVGHEPDLGQWAGWALTGKAQAPFSLKKAGACLLEFDAAIEAGRARLVWLLPAGVLRRLA